MLFETLNETDPRFQAILARAQAERAAMLRRAARRLFRR